MRTWDGRTYVNQTVPPPCPSYTEHPVTRAEVERAAAASPEAAADLAPVLAAAGGCYWWRATVGRLEHGPNVEVTGYLVRSAAGDLVAYSGDREQLMRLGLGLGLTLGRRPGGSSPAPAAPVAAFSGTPLSGDAPLDVTFTDASTNTPTSWLWEKNDGSGWVNFAGTPTTQNPTEEFAAGTWSVRLTATNAGGSGAEEKADYVESAAPAFSPASFPQLRFWVDDTAALSPRYTERSSPATAAAADDPVGTFADASGLGNHYAAASDGGRGVLDTFQTGSGSPVLFVDGVTGSAFYAPVASVSRSNQGFTFWFKFVPTSETWEGFLVLFGTSIFGGSLFLNGGTNATRGTLQLVKNYFDDTVNGPTLQLGKEHAVVVRSNASAVELAVSIDRGAATTYAGAAWDSGTVNSASPRIGVPQPSQGCPHVIQEWGLSAADEGTTGRDNLIAMMNAAPAFNGPFPAAKLFVAPAGNSLLYARTYGLPAPNTDNWGAKTLAGLSAGLLTRHARDGTAGAHWRSMAIFFAARTAPFYDGARAKNVLVGWEWINAYSDTVFQDTVAGNISYAKAYFGLWGALGANSQAVLIGPIAWDMGGQEATIRSTVFGAGEFDQATAHANVWGRNASCTWPACVKYAVDAWALGSMSALSAANTREASAPFVHIDDPTDHQAIADEVVYAIGLV